MLTLTNPTIHYSFKDTMGKYSPTRSWLFAKEMMTRVFELSKSHDCMFSNGAGDKAMTFYRIAEFVRKCDASGVEGITIVQDDKLIDPCSWSSTKTSPFYWAFMCDEETATISVSSTLMRVLINSKTA